MLGSKTPRAFIDSSVLIAAAISATSSARDLLLLHGRAKRVTLLWSELVLLETKRNLEKKAPRALPMLDLLSSVLKLELVTPSSDDIERAGRPVDVKDAPIIAAALSGHADWLCTYDRRHLLSRSREVEQALGLQIAIPDAIINLLDTRDGN